MARAARRNRRNRPSVIPQAPRTPAGARAGLPPGTLDVPLSASSAEIRVIAYGPSSLEERRGCTLAEIDGLLTSHDVVWLDVVGLGDESFLRALADRFHIHPLALEDISHLQQRPKLEAYGDEHFIVARMLERHTNGWGLEQISFVTGPNYVISFQEGEADVFEALRTRLRNSSGKIRQQPADYLLYALLDSVVDSFFSLVDEIGSALEEIEDAVLDHAEEHVFHDIQMKRRDLIMLRRALHPTRDMLATLMRPDIQVCTDATKVYLRDTADHTVQLVDMVDSQKEYCAALVELYMTSVSHKMNEVMKVLTMISTIFIPLSFVAGIYGMNFDTQHPLNMPELRWSYGYPAILAGMFALVVAMVGYFKHKRWL